MIALNTLKNKSKGDSRSRGKRLSSPAQEGGYGFLFLLACLLAAAFLAGIRMDRKVEVFVAGEIANQDVAADQDLLVEDFASTQRKREQVASEQPPVFDLSQEPIRDLGRTVREIFSRVENVPAEETEQLRWQIAEELNTEISQRTMSMWKDPAFQRLVVSEVLPWLRAAMNDGVVGDKQRLMQHKSGILVRDLAGGEERLHHEVVGIMDLARLRASLESWLRTERKIPLRTRKSITTLVFPLLSPNLTLNQETTQARTREVVEAVEPVFYQIKKGEIIVRKGERVHPDQQLKLQALFSQRSDHLQPGIVAGVFLLGLLFVAGMYKYKGRGRGSKMTDRDAVYLGCLMLLFAVFAKVLAGLEKPLAQAVVFTKVPPDMFAYLLPVAGAVGVLAMYFSHTACFFGSFLISMVCVLIMGGGVELFTFYFLGAMFYAFFIKKAMNRNDLLGSVFPLLGILLAAWTGVFFLEYAAFDNLWNGYWIATVNAAASLLLVLAISPIGEMIFGYTSRFRLLELMNLEQPLLQDLMVAAPGTYHHSLVVANMVEAGARAVGVNPLMAKVAALYHDVGKLKNPHYFIENQFGQANRHDKLTPSMSALVLISHVKKGVELAREHKLGPEITEIIRQHHGTTLISYFYNKAKEQAEAKGGEPVRQEEFCYPGPRPQTKEAGLILLADAIEASSRTLVDPTPSRLKGHIQNLVRNIFTQGQLDESELTLKDLHLLTEAFQRVLTGIFHQRIEYPESAGDKEAREAREVDKAPERADKERPVRAEGSGAVS